MKTLLVSLSSIALVTAAFVALGTADAQAAPTPLKFGMDANAMAQQENAGVKADYGTFWIGPWTLTSGWAGPDAQMAKMKAAGVTPAIHLYYWGDDISPSCVENGCYSSLHGSQKTRAGWQQLGDQFATHMNSQMGGAPVVVFLESEFNKGGIESYEPFDGYMADMATSLKAKYPAAIIVLGFGNWGQQHWGNFDRAAAASDLTGLQGMRGSTRDSLTTYHTLYEGTLYGVQKLQTLFGKPILIDDIALSSHPEPEYLKHQADALQELMNGIPQLKAAGVMGIIYRSWTDSPGMDLANYYGEAERHWGLVHAGSAGGAPKPAVDVWINTVKAERASASAPSTSSTTPSTSSAFTASFEPTSSINEWWVEVKVTSSSTVRSVEAKANEGPYHTLTKNQWGMWTKSFNVPKGSSVVFRATSDTGAVAMSQPIQWMGPAAPSSSAPAPTTSSSSPAFSASFQPTGSINEWWVEVKVTSSSAVSKVEAKANNGPYHTLTKNQWNLWEKSFYVPKGSSVVFRATSDTGAVATSQPIQWMGSAPAPTTSSSPSPAFTASFQPTGSINEWWVEVKVTSSSAVSKVEAKANNGPYHTLTKNQWNLWEKSFYVPKGSSVVFRATSASGAVVTSAPIQWMGAAPSTSSAPAFTASFYPSNVGNNWWVEAGVQSSSPIAKVEARENGGAWILLSKTSWGTYAKSFQVEDGHRIEFRATSTTGATVVSGAYTWT